jgi:hypothetical protein
MGYRSSAAPRLTYQRTPPINYIGGKWLCVVVKYDEADAFVVTAYLTNRPKPEEDIWPTK